MTEVPTKAATSHTIAIEHIRISTGRPFAEVRRKLEAKVPRLDTGIAEALRSGDQKRAKAYEESGPKLSIFGERDHGALLQISGRKRNAVQYDIKSPHRLKDDPPSTGRCSPPLRVALFEDEQGRGIF